MMIILFWVGSYQQWYMNSFHSLLCPLLSLLLVSKSWWTWTHTWHSKWRESLDMQERPVSSLPQPHSLNWGPSSSLSTCTGIKLCVTGCASYWLIITCTLAMHKSLGTRPPVPLNLYGVMPSYTSAHWSRDQPPHASRQETVWWTKSNFLGLNPKVVRTNEIVRSVIIT